MSSKKTETRPETRPEAGKPEGAADAKPRAWRVLRPVRHGWVQGGKPLCRTWQSGELMELNDAQAAPLLARGVIEAAEATARTVPNEQE